MIQELCAATSRLTPVELRLKAMLFSILFFLQNHNHIVAFIKFQKLNWWS